MNIRASAGENVKEEFENIVDPLTIFFIDERGEKSMEGLELLIGKLNLDRLSKKEEQKTRQFCFSFIIDGYYDGRDLCDVDKSEKYYWSGIDYFRTHNTQFHDKMISWFRRNIEDKIQRKEELFDMSKILSTIKKFFKGDLESILKEHSQSDAWWEFYCDLYLYGFCVASAEVQTHNEVGAYLKENPIPRKMGY